MSKVSGHVRRRSWSTAVFVGVVLGTLIASTLLGHLSATSLRPAQSPSLPAPHSGLSPAASAVPPGALAPLVRTHGATGAGENATAVGVPGWANVTNTSGKSPSGRSYGRTFAWDPVDQYLVMFGGYSGGGYLGDTWKYANGSWTQLHPKASPSARDHSTLAWDPVDGYLLLFGGSGNLGDYGDTWTFLAGNWTQLTESTHPSVRWAAAMTWDGADQEMVLFGGCNGGALGDTWTFVHGNWTQASPTTHPSIRENVALRFDWSYNRTILFGGDDYGANIYSDTWSFFQGNWTQLTISSHPAGRTTASFEYDTAISSLVLFGGSGGGTLADTWLFANGNWVATHPTDAPPGRYFGEIAYDPLHAYIVLWGGAGGFGELTDTWIFAGINLTASDSASSGVGPLSVDFHAAAQGGTGTVAYLWQFGDGNSSTQGSATNVYGTPGRYLATVTASDANGSVATASFFLRIIAPLTGSAVASPASGLAPLVVQCSAFAFAGSPPYHFAWSAGDGVNSSTAALTAFTYGAPGNYTASVLVNDSNGASWNQTFLISVQPVAIQPLTSEIVASVLAGPAPLTVWFSSSAGGGIAPYQTSWEFGDGANATGTAVNHTFATAGSVTTTFTVQDARGRTHQSSVAIVVGPGLTAAGAAPPSAVANTTAAFSGTITGGLAPYTAVWDFGDSHAAARVNTTHVYATAGTYLATLTVIDQRGVTVSQQFHVSITPAAATGTNTTPPKTSSGGGNAGLTDTELLAIALIVGAAMIAGAMLLVRRMDR